MDNYIALAVFLKEKIEKNIQFVWTKHYFTRIKYLFFKVIFL